MRIILDKNLHYKRNYVIFSLFYSFLSADGRRVPGTDSIIAINVSDNTSKLPSYDYNVGIFDLILRYVTNSVSVNKDDIEIIFYVDNIMNSAAPYIRKNFSNVLSFSDEVTFHVYTFPRSSSPSIFTTFLNNNQYTEFIRPIKPTVGIFEQNRAAWFDYDMLRKAPGHDRADLNYVTLFDDLLYSDRYDPLVKQLFINKHSIQNLNLTLSQRQECLVNSAYNDSNILTDPYFFLHGRCEGKSIELNPLPVPFVPSNPEHDIVCQHLGHIAKDFDTHNLNAHSYLITVPPENLGLDDPSLFFTLIDLAYVAVEPMVLFSVSCIVALYFGGS